VEAKGRGERGIENIGTVGRLNPTATQQSGLPLSTRGRKSRLGQMESGLLIKDSERKAAERGKRRGMLDRTYQKLLAVRVKPSTIRGRKNSLPPRKVGERSICDRGGKNLIRQDKVTTKRGKAPRPTSKCYKTRLDH